MYVTVYVLIKRGVLILVVIKKGQTGLPVSPKGVQWFHIDDDGSVGEVQYNNTQFTFTIIHLQ